MQTYTRDHLIGLLREKFDMPPRLAKQAVEEILVLIARALLEGRRVELRGFGVFEVKQRKPRVGRNPNNKAQGDVVIPARKKVVFRAGKYLHEEINGTGSVLAAEEVSEEKETVSA